MPGDDAAAGPDEPRALIEDVHLVHRGGELLGQTAVGYLRTPRVGPAAVEALDGGVHVRVAQHVRGMPHEAGGADAIAS
ncbi:hypothetical protein GA641_09800 [Bifidobacterium adolescentis]|nr:hypothetical protein GA641_09800 [Bifidobacterium adolescentis]